MDCVRNMVEAPFSFQCSFLQSSGKRKGVNCKESWKVGMLVGGGVGVERAEMDVACSARDLTAEHRRGGSRIRGANLFSCLVLPITNVWRYCKRVYNNGHKIRMNMITV
jgi:hypothetical protein